MANRFNEFTSRDKGLAKTCMLNPRSLMDFFDITTPCKALIVTKAAWRDNGTLVPVGGSRATLAKVHAIPAVRAGPFDSNISENPIEFSVGVTKISRRIFVGTPGPPNRPSTTDTLQEWRWSSTDDKGTAEMKHKSAEPGVRCSA